MRDRRTGLFPLMLVSFVGVASSLLILEIGLRVLDVRPLPIGMGALWQYDDELGWAFRPGMEGWVTKPEDDVAVWVTINPHGWRDKEYTFVPPPNTRRIVLLGDSFSAGIEVELQETFQEQLESKLNSRLGTPRYEVVNTGVPGYGTAQELLVYREYGRLYQPDIVLLEWFVNDVVENSELNPNRSAPTFTRDDRGQYNWSSGEESDPGWLKQIKTLFRQRTLLYPMLVSYFHRLFPSILPTPGGQLASVTTIVSNEPDEKNPVLNLFRASLDEGYEDAWEITEELILMLRNEVEQDGACFAVVMVPFVFSDEFIAENSLTSSDSSTSEPWDYEAPTRRLGDFLTSNNILYLDLTAPITQRLSQDNGALYLEKDGHWNALGHEVVADALDEWIEAEQLDQKCLRNPMNP